MPQIILLPHHEICPQGAVIEAEPGETICDAALRQGVLLWDKRDLDLWIDDVKTGTQATTHDAILARL